MTEIERVKAFAQEILEQCQDKGFTFSEVKALPEYLSLEITQNNNRIFSNKMYQYKSHNQ